ncbi:MAG TPA: lipid-A-disaccharide synthase [Vicinamibacterales bacterium]
MARVMVSCGEASGDLYAGALAAEILRQAPGSTVTGFGGERLRQAGGELLGDYRGFAVTGLVEALRVLPRSYAMYRRLVAHARALRPDVFVAIDFPDFNFRLAAAIRRLGVPVVYYIGPQLWAWRPGRIRTMARVTDLVLPIFPFEPAIYERAGIPVEFVGHPLVDLIRVSEERQPFLAGLGLNPDAPTVALLPGSRPNEVRAILPVLAGSIDHIVARVPAAQFVVARAPKLADELFAPLQAAHAPVRLVEGRTDDVLHASDVVITASGTATVQTALHERPMVIVYRLSPLTYRLGRRFVSVDTFGMANLIAGRRVVPELIQEDFTPERTAEEALAFLTDPARAAAAREGLREVRRKLGEPGASARAARAVLEVAARGRAGVRV